MLRSITFCLGLIFLSLQSFAYNVTFQVDMNGQTGFTTPEVNGTFNGWCGNCAPMSDSNADGIWEVTINLVQGSYEFKYSYDNWAGQETLTPGSSCTLTTGSFTNRILTVSQDVVLPVVCWASCNDCNNMVVMYPVTFQVDMNGVTGFTTPEVNGTFNGWCGNCSAMSDANSDGIWDITIDLEAGSYEYKYSYDNWTGQEALTEGSSCTVTTDGFTNRALSVSQPVVMPPVCWESCVGCGVVVLDQMDLPVTFEDANVEYGVVGFGNAVSTIEVDPTDPLNTVAKVVKLATAATWAGTSVRSTTDNSLGLLNPIPFTSTETFMNVRVWSPDAGIPILLKVEDITDPTRSVQTLANTTVAGQWETLTFDFSNEQVGTAALNLDYTFNLASIFFNYGTDGANAGEKTYYFDDLKFGIGEGGGPINYNVTFQVDMNNVTGFTTPEVNGIFNGWCGNCTPMTDANADGIWEVTASIAAGDYEYKFSYDNWAGQEALIEGMACTVTNSGYTNRTLSVNADVVLPVVCWESCLACNQIQVYQVTFQVDMNGVTGFTTPEVNGNFNDWCGGCFPMTDANADGIWEATTTLAAGTYEYKFAYDSWTGQENLLEGSSCTVTNSGFTNRSLTLTADTELPVVCWESCVACGQSNNYQVTFQVDMNGVSGFTTPEVNGTFNGWCGNCFPMTDANADGIWEATTTLPAGMYEYKYSYDAWAGQEELTPGSSCTITTGAFTNRVLNLNADIVLGVVCWASCSACVEPTPVAVTFKVDVSGETATSAEISGSFNNYCVACEPMTLSGGVYSKTLQLLPGVYDYYYTINGGASTEVLVDGTCTVDMNDTYHRTITVTEATVMPVVCWETCVPCIIGINESINSELHLYPNPAKEQVTITIDHAGNAICSVYNMVGELVVQQNTLGKNQIQLPVSNLESGLYQVVIRSNEFISQATFIVEK